MRREKYHTVIETSVKRVFLNNRAVRGKLKLKWHPVALSLCRLIYILLSLWYSVLVSECILSYMCTCVCVCVCVWGNSGSQMWDQNFGAGVHVIEWTLILLAVIIHSRHSNYSWQRCTSVLYSKTFEYSVPMRGVLGVIELTLVTGGGRVLNDGLWCHYVHRGEYAHMLTYISVNYLYSCLGVYHEYLLFKNQLCIDYSI